jgi:CHAD domain
VYRREAERLSGIGHLLADARDLDVMRQTLAKLEARPESLPQALVAPLQKLLIAESAPRPESDGRGQALVRLKQTRKLFGSKAVQAITLDDLLAGMEFAYQRARKRFRKAYHKPGDEAFHAWRKSVQLHWRHMSLLSRGWPEALSARAGEAKELSRLLGEDHDHSILLAFAADRGTGVLEPEHLAALTAQCRSCQLELRAQAEPRGGRLFAETADNLTGRVKRYWSAAEHLAALAPVADDPQAARRRLRKGRSATGLRRPAR